MRTPHKPQAAHELVGPRPLPQLTRFVQDIVVDPTVWGPDGVTAHQQIIASAVSGAPDAVRQAIELVKMILERYGAEAVDMSLETAADRIYGYLWGLDVLEDLYRDPEIDEIRVNAPDRVFVQRRGRNERTDVRFKDTEHVRKLLARLFAHDRGVALTASTPLVESVRADGTRVTATCPPVSAEWTAVLRKHDTFKVTGPNLVRAGTLDQNILELLQGLVQGRANLMISGGAGSGKTSLLRFLVGYLPDTLRVVVLEPDRELRLAEHYPSRDIIELEEHSYLDCGMDRLFRTSLRYSPDVQIVGEVRGHGEATEGVKACTRGADGSMVTVHFSTPEEAVSGYAKIMVEEGARLPVEVAATWVAQAFNVVVQMFTDTRVGVKKIVQIVEVSEANGRASYRDLVRWKPSGHDYFTGSWQFVNVPSAKLLAKLQRYGVEPSRVTRLFGQHRKVV